MPTRVRHFELREVVASGGMGTVYRAFDSVLERMVAFKLVKREMVEDKQVMDSFYREARAMAALNHTNIIHVYQFDEFDDRPYIVMELADNGSLDSRIESDGMVSELTALDVGIKVASALDTALKHNLLHRDIKPGNILFNLEGEPKLVDFGLAKGVEEEEEYGADVFGTPYYVAPEKIKREAETFLSDMYSLGATLYHALTGSVPFDAPTVEALVAAQVREPLTPPNLVLQEVTQPTSDALVKAMAKNPSDRFLSYDEFIIALEAARSLLLRERSSSPQSQHPAKSKGLTSWWRR